MKKQETKENGNWIYLNLFKWIIWSLLFAWLWGYNLKNRYNDLEEKYRTLKDAFIFSACFNLIFIILMVISQLYV